ncbi:MAG: DNA polymerase III subunit chi [Candidatus Thioglobus sp.]|nr:MAG: DNA polymerase III subunit chi [Candidatus Thioglobus sp.]
MASCRVDFYVPSSDTPDERYTLACRVTEKAFQSGKQVYLYCQTPDQLTQMDERLWTFSLNSFIPHGLLGETDELVRVILGCDDPSPDVAEIVISMANTPVSTFNLFSRVAEIVGTDDSERQLARNRFKFYRDNGVEPVTHKV